MDKKRLHSHQFPNVLWHKPLHRMPFTPKAVQCYTLSVCVYIYIRILYVYICIHPAYKSVRCQWSAADGVCRFIHSFTIALYGVQYRDRHVICNGWLRCVAVSEWKRYTPHTRRQCVSSGSKLCTGARWMGVTQLSCVPNHFLRQRYFGCELQLGGWLPMLGSRQIAEIESVSKCSVWQWSLFEIIIVPGGGLIFAIIRKIYTFIRCHFSLRIFLSCRLCRILHQCGRKACHSYLIVWMRA